MTPTGAGVWRLTFFGYYGSEPAWSWDNQRIALIRPRKDAQNAEHADIFLMKADGSNKHWARSQASSFDMRSPSWSPDGVHLVMAVMFGGKPYLATMNATNGNMAFVMHGGKVVQGNFPSYDATGKKLVYVDGPGRSIIRLDLATDTATPMVSSDHVMGCPTFSPDGTRIAFQSSRTGKSQIFVMSASTGGNVVQVTQTASDEKYSAWSH